MVINILEDIFEVNTSESYSKDIFVYDKNIIIPYINLQIFSVDFAHNKIKRFDKLDFSYLIFKGVKEILWNHKYYDRAKYGKLILNNSCNENDYSLDYISGANVFNEYDGCEFKIKFKEQCLYFSEDDVCVKNGALDLWMPVDTPNFLRNLDEEKVLSFFIKENIPNEILKIIGADCFSAVEVLDLFKPILKDEELKIAKNW
ncbi:hypothetical protein N6B72_07410 [Chryseobacterium soli]|uniref:hypothetical protein n=1 Tax=Chryseobacterium soli TaxID=445961 RepID=UPI0029530658|nr:hypothetical protein [Chryseobacterium soli]MDV7696741.1 hypothetical protein [Chryseobacterium soli]